jgi:hypothetical protein
MDQIILKLDASPLEIAKRRAKMVKCLRLAATAIENDDSESDPRGLIIILIGDGPPEIVGTGTTKRDRELAATALYHH